MEMKAAKEKIQKLDLTRRNIKFEKVSILTAIIMITVKM